MPGRYQFSLPQRRNRDGWFRLGGLDITTTALMVLLGVLSMFWYAVDKSSLLNLAYNGQLVRQGDVWRVVTWPIVNPPTEIWVVLTLAFFWFVGHAIEDRVGRSRFTVLIVTMTILPAIVTTLLQFQEFSYTFGLGVLGIALLAVFALDNPGALFFFGIPAWVLAAVYVGIDVLRYLGDRRYEPLTLELLVIVVGLVGARQYGMVSQMRFIPSFAPGDAKPARPARSRSRPRSKGKSSGSTVVAGPWAGAEPHSLEDEYELNGLLDKISADGMDALSRTEKARLNELSKKLRGH